MRRCSLPRPCSPCSARAPRSWPGRRIWPEPSAYVVRQQLRRIRLELPERVILVIDGAGDMKAAMPEIAAALGAFPHGTELAVLASLDGVEELLPLGKVDAAALQKVAERVKDLDAVGGQDASEALARAWSMVASQGRTVVVWIHGPHPLPPERVAPPASGEAERMAWWLTSTRPDAVLDVMVGRGPNRMAVDLAEHAPFRTVARTASLEQDLKTLFTRWGTEVVELHRDRLPVAELKPPPEARKTSSHLARLWARDELSRHARVPRSLHGDPRQGVRAGCPVSARLGSLGSRGPGAPVAVRRGGPQAGGSWQRAQRARARDVDAAGSGLCVCSSPSACAGRPDGTVPPRPRAAAPRRLACVELVCAAGPGWLGRAVGAAGPAGAGGAAAPGSAAPAAELGGRHARGRQCRAGAGLPVAASAGPRGGVPAVRDGDRVADVVRAAPSTWARGCWRCCPCR